MGKVVYTVMILLTVASAAVVGKPHPNVLLLMVDDLRPLLGCYADTTAVTPSIDALAQIGVTFTKAYAQQALCGPSRTSLLTSRRPSSTGVVDVHRYWRRHSNYSTLPQHFRQHGYYTASAGKIFHPGICSNFTDDALYSWSGMPFHPSTQAYKNSPVCGPHRRATDIVCPVTVEEQPEQTLPDLQTAHYAISFLHRWKQLQRGAAAEKPCSWPNCHQPFFLAVGFHKPHIPLKYPKEFLDLYPLSGVPLPPNRRLPSRLPSVAFNPWNDLRWRHDIASLNLTFPYQAMPDDNARRIIQSYYAATSYTDLLIGDLLTVTERLFPDTVVALLGDHGWSLGEHQEWSKFSNYEVATRVPLIFAGIRGYEKAKRQIMISSQTVRETEGVSSIGRANTSLNSTYCGNGGSSYEKLCSDGKGSSSRCNVGSTKHKTTANRAVDGNSNLRPMNNNSSRHKFGKNVSQQKRKRIKRYLKIRKTLGRHFPRWQGFATKHDLDYEKYWRFGEWFNRTKDEANSPHGSAETETTFSRHGWSHLDKNRFLKSSWDYLPMRRNITYDGIVELVDLFPTLADLAGIQKVPSCQSKSGSMKFDSEYQTVPFDSEDGPEEELCTEGHSLSSLIIDDGNMHQVKKSIVEHYDRFHSHHKDTQDTSESFNHSEESKRITYPSTNYSALFVRLERSVNISVDSFSFVDSQFNAPASQARTNSLNLEPRQILTDNLVTSHSNTKVSLNTSRNRMLSSKQKKFHRPSNMSHLKPPCATSSLEFPNSLCSSSLVQGRVGISQYPRPSLAPSQHPDSDQPRLTETIIMGYSMRSLCYRYTLWVAFNSTAFLPDFNTVYAVELYDHRIDPGENRNLVWARRKVTQIAYARLRTELRRTLFYGAF